MTVLSEPRNPLITLALADARTWCAGRTIDDRPAIQHATKVAVLAGAHAPDAGPELVCAALLHDSPDFAPAELDLDAYLTDRYGPEVTRIVRAMQAEHQALDLDDPPIDVGDQLALLTSTADKIVALTSLVCRAEATGDVTKFFSVRKPLLRLLPYFAAYHHAAAGRLPQKLAGQLDEAVRRLEQATARAVQKAATSD